jgi:hypothetical protein
MAKRKKGPKAQKRAKLQRGSSAKRGRARGVSKSAKAKVTKRTVARAKPKRAPVKKPEVKQPVAPVVEAAAVEVIEQPTPGVGLIAPGV